MFVVLCLFSELRALNLSYCESKVFFISLYLKQKWVKSKLTTSVLNRVSEKPLVFSAFPFKRKLIIKTVSVLCHWHYGHQFLF